MDLFDLFTPAELNQAIEQKLVRIREDGAGLSILNYTDAAMYTAGAWDNPAVRQCRGIIIDEDLQVIARPWAKFFNHGQAEAGDLDMGAPVEVTDKMDGSLGILHYALDGSRRVATRGSFESDQARHATELLNADGAEPTVRWPAWFTPLVEIIYPGNRIVCDYGDRDELVLLGGVYIPSGQYVGPTEAARLTDWAGATAATFPHQTLRDALAAEPRPGAEGLCVRYRDREQIVKIKQDDYVRLHRIVTGLSERSVWEHLGGGEDLGALLGTLPDELHDWTRQVWAELVGQGGKKKAAALITHQMILAELGDTFERKAYAEHAQRHPRLRPYLFMLLDGRDPWPAIHRTLKPAGDTRARTISEDVA